MVKLRGNIGKKMKWISSFDQLMTIHDALLCDLKKVRQLYKDDTLAFVFS